MDNRKVLITDNQNTSNNFAPIFDKQNRRIYFVQNSHDPKVVQYNDQNIHFINLEVNSINNSDVHELNALNSKRNNGVVGVSKNGQKIYLLDAYSNTKGLAYSEFINGKWKKPKPIYIPGLKIKTNNYGFYVHPDERTIIISYQGINTNGLEDLYMSENIDGEWTKPKKLNSLINTAGYEISPFLSANQDTLFFSSNGQKDSYGSADIYYSTKSEDGDWSQPLNMGKPINSEYFDAYLIQADNNYIWASTKANGRTDLFTSTINSHQPLVVKYSSKNVSVQNGNNGSIILDTILGNPPFVFHWSNGVQVKDLYQLKAGIFTVQVIDSRGQQFDTSITIFEPELVENQEINLPQIQYKKDSWEFLNNEDISSIDSLEKIFQLLIQNPTLVIKLISHTDSRGDEARNLILSHNRSRACYKYLVETKGIDPRRIIPIGMGESQPRYFFDQNQKIKFELNDTYINSFQGDISKFEYLHQLNRRTEGIVERINFNNLDIKADPNYLNYLKMP